MEHNVGLSRAQPRRNYSLCKNPKTLETIENEKLSDEEETLKLPHVKKIK